MAVSLDAVTTPPASVPGDAPLEMPAQDFAAAPKRRFPRPPLPTTLARLTAFGGAAALTAYASWQMVIVVSLAEITALQWVMVGLFTLTFGWIALAATAAIAGLMFGRSGLRAPADMPLTSRTALVMPIYNEDPSRTFAALQAMAEALAEQGAGERFEIFVIADTTDPDVWIKETAAVHALRESLAGAMHVWYRRRHENKARKSGNVQEFVTRWGGRYDYMIVLDADSVLAPETLMTLVREMQADPACGIVQTVPQLYGSPTLFGRMQQFAGAVYGPVVSRGIAAWQGDDGNYWGHNAIIRVAAFAAAAGLPVLKGRKPFGGEIMSHDFVEAALIRRAGWSVRMLPAIHGSWEESPPTLLDVAARDRRWAQGNLQHLAVVGAKRLRWPNRAHMLIGVMSYAASPVWLALVAVGTAITAQVASVQFDYFAEEFSLFPTWPIFDSERMIALFLLTMGVLLLPKALGLLAAFFNRGLRRSVGVVALIFGALLETLLSVLYAPIMMLIQSQQIWEILRGRDSGWSRQQREHRTLAWRTLARRHGFHTLFGVALGAALAYISWPLLAWMSPMVVSLALAVPLSRMSGSVKAANALRRCRLLTTPEEVSPPPVIANLARHERTLRAKLDAVTFHALVHDGGHRERHFAVVAPPPAPTAHAPDIRRLSAQHKIAHATDREGAIAALSDEERAAVLMSAKLFESLVELRNRNEHPPT